METYELQQRIEERERLGIGKAVDDLITFGTGAVIVTGAGGVEQQAILSIIEQANHDVYESFCVPIEFLTRGSYE